MYRSKNLYFEKFIVRENQNNFVKSLGLRTLTENCVEIKRQFL
jgi:hypothetical protein